MNDPTLPGATQWIALVTAVGDAQNPGQEVVAADYQRLAVPLPDDSGAIPSLSIAAKPGWPLILGYELWDAPDATGTYLVGATLNWPLGPGGSCTLLFAPDGTPREPDPITGL